MMHLKLILGPALLSFAVSNQLGKVKDIGNFRLIYPNSETLHECVCSTYLGRPGDQFRGYNRTCNLSCEMFLEIE